MTDENGDKATSANGTENRPSANSTDKERELLSERDREWIERTATEIGPLSPEEREDLARIFQAPHRRSHRRRAPKPAPRDDPQDDGPATPSPA